MAVISLTVAESPLQLVAGVPRTVTISTNVPATIFYTTDGTTPTTSSSVATGPISLPTDIGSFTFKAFATDGTDSSAVFSKNYGPNHQNLRKSHDRITGVNNVDKTPPFPYGSRNTGNNTVHKNISPLKVVDAADIDGIPDGFDGQGNYANETDKALAQLELLFSETNSIGETGVGIGTLPGEVTVKIPEPIQESPIPSNGQSDPNKPLFNPKALVIFQDGTEEPYDPDHPAINKPFFNLENRERARDGSYQYTTAFEGNTPSGAELIQRYNPKDNTITYYYYDQRVNRWIISKEPFSPKNTNIFNLARIVPGREKGVGKVFQWKRGHYHTLF